VHWRYIVEARSQEHVTSRLPLVLAITLCSSAVPSARRRADAMLGFSPRVPVPRASSKPGSTRP